jgi:hypothetical protein
MVGPHAALYTKIVDKATPLEGARELENTQEKAADLHNWVDR